jgi:hypothetical protein
MRGFTHTLIQAVAVALLLSSCGTMDDWMGPSSPDYEAIINAPDRTDADRKNDERREPVKMLAFTGVHPGSKVCLAPFLCTSDLVFY